MGLASRQSIQNLARRVMPHLHDETASMPLRLVAEWLAETKRLGATPFAEAIGDDPLSTGSAQWDALLAGVVEQECLRRQLPCPPWAFAPHRFLAHWWFLSRHTSLHPSAFVEAPAALANRGVFVHAADLQSI